MGQNYGIPCKYVWQPRTDPNLGEPNRALSLAPRPWFSKSQGEPGGWSRRRGSNPHGTKYHWILSPARLPVPPLRGNNSNYHARRSHSRHHVVSQRLFCEFLKRKPTTQLDFAPRRHRHGDSPELRRIHEKVRRVQVYLIQRVAWLAGSGIFST